ncbi:hypothetical protein V5R04_07315 [Jonesiaceae bacterium BS-20]|uniref:Fibronectin type-III domain-containing protein n=1 Tax=Jonesiaceae bacterium BS-20 TaxID=3120821 RepID=A0AAU7E0W3_9MICO
MHWDFRRELPLRKDAMEYSSSAAFQGSGRVTAGKGEAAVAPKSPDLKIITDASDTGVIGIDAPVLSWTDMSASAVQSWSIYRVVSGEKIATSLGWELMTVLVNGDASALSQTLTWTDRSLAAGHTAQYVVRANPRTGKIGPSSNQVSSGLRPAVTTGLSVVGGTEQLTVSWASQVGATRYDIYRDGALYQRWSDIAEQVDTSGATMSWVDATGYGHAHTYSVVASNRWELSAVHAQGAHGPDAQTLEPGVGTLLTAGLGAPGKLHARLSPAPKGGFTAPVTPVLVQMVNKQPGDVTNPSATWDAKIDVTWPKAVWTGQYSDAAATATRYTLKRGGSVLADRTTDLQVVDNGAPRGVQSTWTLVADAGPGLPGAPEAKGLLAWPSAPSCVAAAGTPASSSARVTATAGSGQTVAQLRARLGTVGARPGATTYTATPRGPGFMVDGSPATFTGLSHGTGHGFRAQAKNGGGFGPWSSTECSTTTTRINATASLKVGNATGGQTTRALTGAVTTTNGGTITRTLTPGASGAGSSATTSNAPVWTTLKHNTAHVLKVTNSDGFNTFTVSSPAVRTVALTGSLKLSVNTAKPTRSLHASLTSGLATSHAMTLARGENGGATTMTTAKTKTYDKLGHGAAHTLTGTITDGYNNVALASVRANTTALAKPVVTISGTTTTRAVTASATATAQPGTSRRIKVGAGGWQTGTFKFDKLKHNTNHVFTAQNTDGYNTVDTPRTVKTVQLATPKITTSGLTTRAVTARATATAQTGTSQKVRLASGGWLSGSNKFDKLKHNTKYTIGGQNTDGHNTTTASVVITTARLAAPAVNVSSTSTRSITASATATGQTGTTRSIRLGAGSWRTGSAKFDKLSDGVTHTLTARNTDGHNTVTANRSVRTTLITAPRCTASSTDTTAPGNLTVSGSGGNGTTRQVKLSSGGTVYATSSKYYSGLGAGTYYGYARSTDGYNYSGWTGCAGRTIAPAFRPSGWGGSAPGCPVPLWYVHPGSPNTWQVRRSTVTTCNMRVVLTKHGSDVQNKPVGTVTDMHQYVLGSGAAGWTKLWGTWNKTFQAFWS